MKFLEIKISELPDCYQKEQLEKLTIEPKIATVFVVAKEGSAGDWACYIGFPDYDNLKPEFKQKPEYIYYCNYVREPDSVASNGDKLSKEIAIQLFPEFKEKVYRK